MIETFEQQSYSILLVPLVILGAAVLVGLLLEYGLLPLLKRFTRHSPWQTDELFLDSLPGMGMLWAALVGIYFASLSLPMLPTLALRWVLQGLFIIFIISIIVVVLRLSTGLTNLYSGRGDLPSVSILKNILRIIVLGIGALFILQSVGLPITPALAALGVGGLAVSLALQETLSNLFSGILLVLSNQIRPGNYVRLNTGEEGYVADVTWHTTRLRQLANNIVIVPNAKMTSSIVTNYWDPDKELAVLIDLGVSYDSDLEHVERVTTAVAQATLQEVAGGVAEFEPFIRYNTFADSSINFTVILRGREFSNQFLLKHEFVKRLHRRYREEGIVIPYPTRTIRTPHAAYLEIVQRDGASQHQPQPPPPPPGTDADERPAAAREP